MSYKTLRDTLLKKLNISEQALYKRAATIRRLLPMEPKEAVCVIAHQQEIPINRYLDGETVEKVRILVQQLSTLDSPAQAKPAHQRPAEELKSPKNTIAIPKEFDNFTDIISPRKMQEALAMTPVYILLYVLENSIREIIDHTMKSKYGGKWWDSHASDKLKKKVRGHMSSDQRNRWHQRRGARPIDYLDMNELPTLVRHIQAEVVPDVIPSLEWFDQFIAEIYKSRCVVCHMNPLSRDNVSAVKLRTKHWEKQVRDLFSKP